MVAMAGDAGGSVVNMMLVVSLLQAFLATRRQVSIGSMLPKVLSPDTLVRHLHGSAEGVGKLGVRKCAALFPLPRPYRAMASHSNLDSFEL